MKNNKINNLDTKECDGCAIRNRCDLKPHYIDCYGNEKICPCSTCLVKGICKDSCQDFYIQYQYQEEDGI